MSSKIQIYAITTGASLVVLALGVFVWHANADRYEITRDEADRVVLVDTRGGGVQILEEAKLVEATKPDVHASTLKSFNTLTVRALDSVEASLSTKWVRGRMLYKFRVTPYTGALKEAREDRTAQLIIIFKDSDDFHMYEERILIGSMVRIVDADREGLHLDISADVEIPFDLYSTFTDWTVQWRL